MPSIKPLYLLALVLVVGLYAYIKISNPYSEYSTEEYWNRATLESVSEIPDEALLPGNENGPVLMWAAIGSNNTAIIKALVGRGADINEADGKFKGTPLSGAAAYTKNPAIIEELIMLGADINQKVHDGKTALMVAAQSNHNPGIIKMLVKHNANLSDESHQGETAYDLAKLRNNQTATKEIESLLK